MKKVKPEIEKKNHFVRTFLYISPKLSRKSALETVLASGFDWSSVRNVQRLETLLESEASRADDALKRIKAALISL